ncbi:hypothetical protein HZS_2201, partial [Henneguya salminicola]
MANEEQIEESNVSIMSPPRNNSRSRKLNIKKKLIDWGPEKCELLLDGILSCKEEYNKSHPKTVVRRRHIDWNYLTGFMKENDVESNPVELRQIWLEICSRIEIERNLQDLVDDARKNLSRITMPNLTNPYMLFTRKEAKKIKIDNLTNTLAQISKDSANKWNSLSQKKKDRFKAKSDKKNKILIEKYPQLGIKRSKKRKNRLTFELAVPIPVHNLFTYFGSKIEKPATLDSRGRQKFVRSRWNSMTPEEAK